MKHINKLKLRKIKVGNEKFLWKRGHYHKEEFKHFECVEKVIIYLDGYKKSPLHLLFREEDNILRNVDVDIEKWCVGYPEDGVIWLFKPRKDRKPQTVHTDINLNRPAVISTLIEYYILNEWNPKEQVKPLVIENALLLLDRIDFPLGIN